ncbi:MAG: hypothetical protein EBR28_07225 [Planctomycetia bacterium]|nr:hypothetical protein [Planctomycetia bacterium]
MVRVSTILCLLVIGLGDAHRATAADCCTSCATTCAPRWEDKKTKKPKYSLKCDEECVRGFDAWCDHGCCPEDTPPCAGVFTKKKLIKREVDKVERVLKYDLGKASCIPCNLPPCDACRPCWYDLPGLCRKLFAGW